MILPRIFETSAGKITLTNSQKKIIFFDWNGTFIDDEAATVEAFRAVLRGVNDERYKLSLEELTELHADIFEIPLSKMYDKINLSEEQKQLSNEGDFWAKSYNKTIPQIKTHVGIDESLEILKKYEINFGILSNHTIENIKNKLQEFGFPNIPILANRCSSEAHDTGKLHRMEAYQKQNPETEILAIVGDSVEEVEIAKSIAAKSIALSNGWIRADRIEPSNPDYLIDSAELPAVIKEIISA